ncbi:MAG: hypothetical protein FD189_2470 [Elusimicrobia bacterium]|nr:MAG: hypothetical protein FD154_2425 [Elusimicrobiota bacterium]KAF0152499.1 MAG: hypothetical protein FD189_2470 [Elusimicrobiota bacterium]
MFKNILILMTGAALLGGCGKSQEQVAVEKAAASAERAAAEEVAKAAAGPTEADKKAAAKALLETLCSSTALMEEVEMSMDLFEALSGEGADKNEARNHFIRSQSRYRAMMEMELSARGASYKAFSYYAADMMPGYVSPERRRAMREIAAAACKGRSLRQVERTAGAVLFYCAAPVPQ